MRSTQCTRLSAPKWMLTRLWLQCRQRRITIFAALNRFGLTRFAGVARAGRDDPRGRQRTSTGRAIST